MMTATNSDTETLAWLQREYGEDYRIRRIPGWWIATRRIHDDREPTITKATAEELAYAMAYPARRIGWWDPL